MNSRSALLAAVVATVLLPASAMGMASAELYRTQSYLYGRFDARIQFAPGDGVVSAFFLWKEGSDASNAYWNELDYEKIAADCHMQINSIYGNPRSNHSQTPSLSSICTAYHDYRFEWTPTYIAWVVDGKEIRRDTGDAATAYSKNASAGMTFHFNIWPGDSSFGGNINNTTLPVHQYISWVQYSSYDNGNFNVQWREEFQSSGLPSGWAVGNWGSPYSLSTHNAQNVGFVNGIGVLSLTADNATGSPGTPPADPGAVGSGGAAGGSGGVTSTGGTGTGGATASGGTTGSGGSASTGGAGGSSGSGGSTPKGDSGAGGVAASGGTIPSGGRTGWGGTTASGGTTGAGGGTSTVGSGGATGSGGTTGAGGGTSTAGSGGETVSGGTTHSGGVTGPGGTTDLGGTTTTGGVSGGGSVGNQSGCSCNTANQASPLGPTLLIFFVIISISRLRRKES